MNEYPPTLIDKCVNQYVSKKITENESLNTPNDEDSVRYYKLPYVGPLSLHTQRKISVIIKKFCKPSTDIKLIFTSFKISSLFSTKNSIPKSLKSCIVYKFTCACCNAAYIGETSRHLGTRIREHLVTDKQSHIYKHLNSSSNCKQLCNEDCFSILDHGKTKYQLRIKEGIHIGWSKPELNKQVKCLTTSIVV